MVATSAEAYPPAADATPTEAASHTGAAVVTPATEAPLRMIARRADGAHAGRHLSGDPGGIGVGA